MNHNGQQRTYQVTHVFNNEKKWFKDCQDSPVATNYSEQELATYMERLRLSIMTF